MSPALPQVVAPGRSVSVVHVVNTEEAFQQEKVDLLWRLVCPQALTAPQVRSVLFSDSCGVCDAFAAMWLP